VTGPRARPSARNLRRAAGLAALLGLFACLFAPAPANSVGSSFEQIRHFVWHPEEGAPTNIQGIAQSPDGFLWLASATGLYRFDGLTFERIPLEGGDDRQSLQVASVAAAPNGDVWIGYDWGGIAVYRGGHLRPANPGPPSTSSVYLIVTGDGALWARVPGRSGSRLTRHKDGQWTEIDESWNLPLGTNSIAMLVARDGSLYLVNPDGVRRLRPGARRFEFQPLATGYGPTIAEDPHGRIWLANADALFRVEFGRGRVGPVTSLPHSDLYRRLAFDAEGAAWIAGAEDGIRRLSPDATGEGFRMEEPFDDAAGLSSRVTLAMARDNENNIWVGTLLGLDRFSARRAIRNAGLPLSYVFDTFTGPNGEAWLVSNDRLFRIGRDGPELIADIRSAETICGDRDGLVVATASQLFSYRDGRVREIGLPAISGESEPRIYTCGFDPDGRLLVSLGRHPLYRLEAGGWRPIETGAREIAYGILPAPGGGTLVIYPKERIVHLSGDRGVTLWSTRQGSIGFIKTAATGRGCTLLGGQNGLGCLSGGGMKILSATTYPQLVNVSGIIERPDGWTWLIALPGIMRVRTADLYAAFDAPGRELHFQSFGVEDRLRGETMMMHPRNAIADRFGRIWFFTSRGLVSLDPAQLGDVAQPPRVMIKALVSNGRAFDVAPSIALPVGTRSFQIDYTATALTDPTGTTFRYRLDGVDSGWVEAGGRRQAFYTNLAPGEYRFRVAAVNSAGTPSREEAVVEIRIAPRFIQTRAFVAICVVLAILLATLLYRWRVRSLAARFDERLQERLDERERIARELHDTLLQGVSGLLLQFQGLATRVPSGETLRADMESALDRAETLVVEGRDRVRNLRAGDAPRDLEEALALALTQPGIGQPIAVRIVRSGSPRDVAGTTAGELAAIAAEVLANAIRHGKAETLMVTLSFEARWLQVTFDDDGIGIPAEIARAGARAGHFGLVGMRERAERLQGTLHVDGIHPRGTRVRVSIPARCAYPGQRGLFSGWRRARGPHRAKVV
jgi:signal transduction histidine kinase/ligand-binding sensor domain-containing protein